MHCCNTEMFVGAPKFCHEMTLPEQPAAVSSAGLDCTPWMVEALSAYTSVTESDVPEAHHALLRTVAGHTAPTVKTAPLSTTT